MLEKTLSLLTKFKRFLIPKTLWEGSSPLSGQIKVVEFNGVRRLIVNGYTQSRTLEGDNLTHAYWDGFLQLKSLDLKITRSRDIFSQSSKIKKVLVLGLGGGTVVKLLNYWIKPEKIEAIELDSKMVELGRNYFDLEENNLNITIGDAVEIIKNLKKGEYDLICVDLFVGNKTVDDADEFYLNLKELLTPKGGVIVNKILGELELKLFRERLKKTFSKVYVQSFPAVLSSNDIPFVNDIFLPRPPAGGSRSENNAIIVAKNG